MDDSGSGSSSLGNKEIMSENLRYYVSLWEDETGKTREEIAKEIDIPFSSFNAYVRGAIYPRIDKIERMAKYFGIDKPHLIEKRGTYISLSEEEKKIAARIFSSETAKRLLTLVSDMEESEQRIVLTLAKSLTKERNNDGKN